MKKTILTLAVAAFTLSTVKVVAQDKASTANTERSAENIQKEADAIKHRVEQYTIKVEANKDNANMDYEAEKARIAEMKARWETVTGKTWVDDKKKKK